MNTTVNATSNEVKNNSVNNTTRKYDRFCSPNVKRLYTGHCYEDLTVIVEKNFIVNGRKLNMDELMRSAIKLYLLDNVHKYRFVKANKLDKLLNKNIHFGRTLDASTDPYQKFTYEQITTLVRCLIKQLRFSKNLEEDILGYLGETHFDLAARVVAGKNGMVFGIKQEDIDEFEEWERNIKTKKQ